MAHIVLRQIRLLAVLAVLAAVVSGHSDVNAQQPVKGDDPPALTRTMQALLADREPAVESAPQAATPCVSGFAGAYPCQFVDLLAYMPLTAFSAGSGNDNWGWTDPTTGKEYALMGLNNGTGFVDISNPESPLYLGKLPTHTSNSSWRDIKVYANHAFIVSEASGHGMQVFDLTQLRTVANPPVTFAETAHYNQFGNAHNIVINEQSGFAYAVGTGTCNGGLHMVNIQTPASPANAGCFSADGYTHDAQCVNYSGPDPDHQGKEICFASNEDTLTIVDVTVKTNPVQISRTGYANVSYTHQAWIDESQTYLLLDDELDEQSYGFNTRTRIFNISNLDAPQFIDYYSGTTPAIDHNLYIKDGYAYLANYRAGLQILNLSGIATGDLSQTAYFDIYPANNNANFNGAWSNYPYFASGVVIVSGIEQGLFILRPVTAATCLDFNASGVVDVSDISRVTAAWGTNNPLYDFNRNGPVDVEDIATAGAAWETPCN